MLQTRWLVCFVCMCMCMYVCIYVCYFKLEEITRIVCCKLAGRSILYVYVCIHVCLYVGMYAYVFIYLCASTPTFPCVHARIYISTCTACTHIHMHMQCMHAPAQPTNKTNSPMQKDTHTHTHKCTNAHESDRWCWSSAHSGGRLNTSASDLACFAWGAVAIMMWFSARWRRMFLT